HAVIGAWLAGAFLVISVSAYYLLKKRHGAFAKASLKVALTVASVAVVLQAISGDSSAEGVAVNQPYKLAALEGVYETQKGAPLLLGGFPNSDEKRVVGAIGVPKLLSFLAFRDFNAEVKGLDQIPRKDWPNVPVVFQTYRLMLAMWGAMVLVCVLGWFYRKQLQETTWLLWLMVVSAIFPQLANQAGWVSAEMGRYPWIVQNLLRISEGLSKAVVAHQVLTSIIMFGLVYFFLLLLFIFLLNDKIQKGPTNEDLAPEYHHMFEYIEEAMHD
ncbi:MAG: cytochrome ubiquinol oxidase subunit I, partial [Chlamydiia bacterium]|nr:cytochrome ubiquinol oxidase subunit I [Chlamydiia bacterium]